MTDEYKRPPIYELRVEVITPDHQMLTVKRCLGTHTPGDLVEWCLDRMWAEAKKGLQENGAFQ